MQQKASPDTTQYSAEEWQVRIDLAAAHRMAVREGLHEGIFNHLTARVPGKQRYYQIPFGTHWAEVTASCFMEVSYEGVVEAGEGHMEQSAYCIHAPIHRDVDHAGCVMHTHMPFASALTRLKDPRIKPIGQTEVLLMKSIAYDMDYAGPAFDPSEGERLAGLVGDKTILFMANHGVTTVARTVAEAYDKLYYIERAAQQQLYAMWTGQPLRELPADIIEKTMNSTGTGNNNFEGKKPFEFHFAALKRLLDCDEPDYAA